MLRYWTACVTVCVLAMAHQMQEQPYCSARYERLCQGKGPHVACQFPYHDPGEACENYTAIIFTNDLKQFILHYVNRRRQRIAAGHERVRGGMHLPKPELMMMVQWDRELAFLAQRLANQCQFVHDDCRATVRYPYAGQTVGEVRWRRLESIENGAPRVIGRVFDAWWGEKRRVQAKQLTSPFTLTARGAVWGHFSQLAVWTLRAMGCGAVHHGLARPRLLLVCDFSHTNMLGQRTISPGPMASCPQHTTRLQHSPYPLLCAPVRNKIVAEDYVHQDDNEGEDNGEENEEEVTLSVQGPYKFEPDDIYITRPCPNRPVRPIQDVVDFTQHLHNEDDLVGDHHLRDRLDYDTNRYSQNNRQGQKPTDTLTLNQRQYDSIHKNPPGWLKEDIFDRPFYETVNANKRPLQDDTINTFSVESSKDNVAVMKSLQDKLIETDQRPVRPIDFLAVDRIVKPVNKNEDFSSEKDNGWKESSTDRFQYHQDDEIVTKIYLRYRSSTDEARRNNNKAFISKEEAERIKDAETDTRIVEQDRNRELDWKNKALYKLDNYRNWEMRRKEEYKIHKDFEMGPRMLNNWRDERIREDEAVLPLQKQTKSQLRNSVTTIVVYRPTSLLSIATEAVFRRRYKQTRNRPDRPGANALLQSTPPILNRRQTKKASLMLDKDDEEQLYHDTGFKLSTVN